MKKLFILSILASTLLYSSIGSKEITNMIKKIKEERIGINIGKLESTVNPFIMNVKKEVVVEKYEKDEVKIVKKHIIAEPVYKLDAILNHAAFINKKWYKKGDKLGAYRVGSIGTNSVILKSKSGRKTLFIKNKKKNFIQLNQGSK